MSALNDHSHLDKNGYNGVGPTASPHLRIIANPGPLGLLSFAATWWILSLYQVFARGVSLPNVILGVALFYGGLAQLLAGMWEFVSGNTFGATVFTTYGAFWLSFAAFYIPSFGIRSVYDSDQTFASALGIYFSAWFIITVLFLIASLRSNIGLIATFFFLTLTFMFLMIDEFTGNSAIHKTAGAFGIVTSLVAFYVGLAGLMTPDHGIVALPVGPLNRRRV